VKSGGRDLAHELEKKGYGWIDDPRWLAEVADAGAGVSP
jgi:hypothetical protein